MSVHVAKENDLVFFVVQSHKLLREVNGRVDQSGWVRPATVKIGTYHIAAIVAYYDAIRVQHGHNLKDESVSQQLRLSVILLKQEFYRTMYHEL